MIKLLGGQPLLHLARAPGQRGRLPLVAVKRRRGGERQVGTQTIAPAVRTFALAARHT